MTLNKIKSLIINDLKFKINKKEQYLVFTKWCKLSFFKPKNGHTFVTSKDRKKK